MSKVEFARDKLRAQLSDLVDEYEAMFVLLAQMNSSVRARFEAERVGLGEASKRQLQAGISRLSAEVKRLRRETGATRPLGTYARFLKAQVAAVPANGFVLSLPVYMALFLFSKYPNVARGLENHELPAHAFIELDHGGRYEPLDQLQFHIIEAMLFEDMCFFWNEASRITQDAKKPHSNKFQIKRLAALLRAAMSSAFYMVEAFCNGIALEVYLTRQDSLSEKDLQRITEWDAKRGCQKFQTMRDKILHYPRLLIGASSPLIQESNSPELSYFLSSAKELRDAIVHANPAPDYNTLAPQKWQTLLRLNHTQCGEIVDCSVAVIDQVATAIDRRDSIFWLQPRQPNGLFDETVFD
jgi:hypothetical protein